MGCRKPCSRPLANQVPFQLRQNAKDVEYKASRAGSGVDGLLKAPESNALFLQTLNSLNQILQRTSQMIQPSNQQGVPLSHVLECCLQAWSFATSPADFVFKDLSTTGFLQRIRL
jgi:hypothetical protein